MSLGVTVTFQGNAPGELDLKRRRGYFRFTIGIKVKVLANGPGGLVIPKTQKMVLDAALLNTNHGMVQIKSKVEQSREWRGALLYTPVYWKGSFRVRLDKGLPLKLSVNNRSLAMVQGAWVNTWRYTCTIKRNLHLDDIRLSIVI